MGSLTWQAFGDRVEHGTNVVYGAVHQLSGFAGRRRSVFIPARPYLGVSSGDARAIEAETHDWFRGALGR